MLFKFIYLIGFVFSYPINYYCTNYSGICLDHNFKNRFNEETITYIDSNVSKKNSNVIYFYYDDSCDNIYFSNLDNIYRYITKKKIISDKDKLKNEFDNILFGYDNRDENDNTENLLILFAKKFLFTVIYLIGVFSISSIFSMIFIGKYIYKNMKSNKKYLYIEDEKQDKDDFYQFNYIEEYDELNDEEITEEKFKNIENVFISEETPKGLVHMSYDRQQEAFIYYAKSSSIISFNYLDCVARQFVIKFNCKKWYRMLEFAN